MTAYQLPPNFDAMPLWCQTVHQLVVAYDNGTLTQEVHSNEDGGVLVVPNEKGGAVVAFAEFPSAANISEDIINSQFELLAQVNAQLETCTSERIDMRWLDDRPGFRVNVEPLMHSDPGQPLRVGVSMLVADLREHLEPEISVHQSSNSLGVMPFFCQVAYEIVERYENGTLVQETELTSEGVQGMFPQETGGIFTRIQQFDSIADASGVSPITMMEAPIQELGECTSKHHDKAWLDNRSGFQVMLDPILEFAPDDTYTVGFSMHVIDQR